MRTPLADVLFGPLPKTRFHMPGHKGRGPLPFASFDITEISGADNLFCPTGPIADSQALFAAEQGAAHALYSVNGSTACAHAALLRYGPGDEVIMARDVHVSAISAAALAGFTPVFVETAPPPAVVCKGDLFAAIERHPSAKAVYLTYPNAYGMCCPLREIADEAHARGMEVIVDAAHAAHFAYHPALPKPPGECGADIWFISAHKTLPAATQTAVLLFCADDPRLKECLNLVQSTSPSYPLLLSLDLARAQMAETGRAELTRLLRLIEAFRSSLPDDLPALLTDDPTRLVLDCRSVGGGFTAAQALSKEGIEAESADETRLVLICTVADRAEDFDRLLAGLSRLPRRPAPRTVPSYRLLANTELSPFLARRLSREAVGLKNAAGRLLAAPIVAYPPGVPISLPGERLCEERLLLLERMKKNGYNLLGYDETLFVLRET